MRLQILADDERVDYAICSARVKKFLSEAEHSSIDLLKVRYLLDRAGFARLRCSFKTGRVAEAIHELGYSLGPWTWL